MMHVLEYSRAAAHLSPNPRMQCNKFNEKPVKLWASFNFELIVVWFCLSLFRLWLRNIKHGRLSLRENHEHAKYRVKRCFFNQSWSSKLFAVDDCCQRKLSGKEINRNLAETQILECVNGERECVSSIVSEWDIICWREVHILNWITCRI